MNSSESYRQALLDPGSVYDAPKDVLADDNLNREQKIEVLRHWMYDASELSVAEEEGMVGGEESFLRQIVLALEELGVTGEAQHGVPIKQDGA